MNSQMASTSSKDARARPKPESATVVNDSDDEMPSSKPPRPCPSQEMLVRKIADYNAEIDKCSRTTGGKQAERVKELEALRSASEKRLKNLRSMFKCARKRRQLEKEKKRMAACRQALDDPPSPELGKWASHPSGDEEAAMQGSAEPKPKARRKRSSSTNVPRSSDVTPRTRRVISSKVISSEPMSKKPRSMPSRSKHSLLAIPSADEASKKAVKLVQIASLLCGTVDNFGRPKKVLRARPKLEGGNTLSPAANTRAKAASSRATVAIVTTTPVRPRIVKRCRTLDSATGSTPRRTGSTNQAKMAENETVTDAADPKKSQQNSKHSLLATPSAGEASKKAAKLVQIASLLCGTVDNFGRPKKVLRARPKLEGGNTLSPAANTRAKAASSTASVTTITTTPMRPRSVKRRRTLDSSMGSTPRHTGSTKRAKMAEYETVTVAADPKKSPFAYIASEPWCALTMRDFPEGPSSPKLDELMNESLPLLRMYRAPPEQVSAVSPANEASSKHEPIVLVQGSQELQPQDVCSTSGNQSDDLPSTTSTGEHDGECSLQIQEEIGVDVLDKNENPGMQTPDEHLVASTSAAVPIINERMIRKEGEGPQKHNLFNERLALFTEQTARMLNDNVSVKSLTPDSSDSSDLDSDSDTGTDLATKCEKYQDPEFLRQNPELAEPVRLLNNPIIRKGMTIDKLTVDERYPGRNAMFTIDEPVYLVSEEDENVNGLSLLEQFVLSDPRSDIHHQTHDGLMTALYGSDCIREPSSDALGGLEQIRMAYADSDLDEEPDEDELKAVEPNPNAALPFATAVSVMRFLAQSETDIFPKNISDVLAQPPSGSQTKPDPQQGQLTPPSEALPDGSSAVQPTDIGGVQANLREKLTPVEADLRTELMWPTLKTVLELLPLFDLSEWTSDQMAALLFALARIYIDKLSGAGVKHAVEKTFHEILDKSEQGEDAHVNEVLTKFLKLFPLIDDVLGGLYWLISTIFPHFKLLQSRRVKALAELVAYHLESLPQVWRDDRSQVEEDRRKISSWKLPQDLFDIYRGIPHIFRKLVREPRQLYHFVQILNEVIVGIKDNLYTIRSDGLDYMRTQQICANSCLKKDVYDHMKIFFENRAFESIEDVYSVKHRELSWLVNRKDDDDDSDDSD